MGFSRQEPWSGLPFPSPGDLPDPGIEPSILMSPALAGGFFTTRATSSRLKTCNCFWYSTVIQKKCIWWGHFQVFNTVLTQWTDWKPQPEWTSDGSQPHLQWSWRGREALSRKSQQGTQGHEGKTDETAPVCTLHPTRQASVLLRSLAPNRTDSCRRRAAGWVAQLGRSSHPRQRNAVLGSGCSDSRAACFPTLSLSFTGCGELPWPGAWGGNNSYSGKKLRFVGLLLRLKLIISPWHYRIWESICNFYFL